MTRPSPQPAPIPAGGGPAFLSRVRDVADRLGAELGTETPDEINYVGDMALPIDPESWAIEAAVVRALGPGHVLFLCVANSARSQLAHGLAAEIASDDVTVSSAGSAPTSVRPHAVEVLREIGIDIAHHRSRSIEDVPVPVDTVITLCAEEVCPVWIEPASRLHWGLPDPAAVTGTREEELAAFRTIRDELRRRLVVLLGP